MPTRALRDAFLSGESRRIALALLVLLCGSAAANADKSNGDAPTTAAAKWVYLDNGAVRLGVKTSSGAAIGYFSPSKSDRNLINHHDHGRLVQQSYYGSEDGSDWAGKPWRWNPVQGGDYKGSAARVLELRVERPDKLYAKTLPKHWATGADLSDVTMEQWITLTGKVAHVRYRMSYAGTATHPEADQEIPAVFVDPALDTLVRYDGDKPWTGDTLQRSRPGWPNEYHAIAENWAAYARADGPQPAIALGAYVPAAQRMTCYRFGDGRGPDACSYFAPLTRFAVKPGFTFEYDLYLAAGTVDEIRAAFGVIHDAEDDKRADVLFEDPFGKALGAGWTWVRPVEDAAQVTDGVLRVRPSSGTLREADNTGTNILLRPALADEPSYSVEVTVVPATGDAKAPGLYEQAGLLWYVDDDNYVKLCTEYYEDRWWVVLGAERNGKAEYAQAKLDAGTVRLRLTITEGRATGAFRDVAAKDWHDAGSFEIPKSPAAARLGLLAQTGPDAPDRHVGFDMFAIRRVDD